MKKVVHYFLIAAFICFITILVIGFFNVRTVYKSLVWDHEQQFPRILVRIINKFTRPPPAPPVLRPEQTIRIPEGWTDTQIADYLAKTGEYSSRQFLDLVGSAQAGIKQIGADSTSTDFSLKFPFLKNISPKVGLEGYLFPDTYRIYASSTPSEIISRMLDNFTQKITPQMLSDIKSQGHTLNQVIVLASIVEKEAPLDYTTGDDRDARIIAGIFWNRLKIGQALESDATLSYILDDNISRHKANALDLNSPYNTYKYRGLPPGPICNPGLLAIKAVIYPLKTDYNYFLTPPGQKTVIYARTYQEHLNNVYKYLR